MDHGAQEQDGGNRKRLVIDVDHPSVSLAPVEGEFDALPSDFDFRVKYTELV